MKIFTEIVCLINHLGHLEWKDLKISKKTLWSAFLKFGVDQELSFRRQQSGFRNQSVRRNLFKDIRKECSWWDNWKLPVFCLWKPKIIQIEQREYMHHEHLPFFHIYCIAQGTGGSCGHKMQFYQGAVTLAILAAGNPRGKIWLTVTEEAGLSAPYILLHGLRYTSSVKTGIPITKIHISETLLSC